MSEPILSTALCGLLGIDYPILQSGMGGIAGPELAASISSAGGLGVLAGTLTPPDDLRGAIRRVRELTDRPFGVNLLMLGELREPDAADELEETAVAAVHEMLNPVRARFGLPARTDRPPRIPDLITPALKVIIEEHVPVFSAGLGDPGSDLTTRLHEAGIMTMVMVTNRDDAVRVEANGADVIVAQGWEGGGHRSHFTKSAGDRLADLGTLVVVAEIADAVAVPVVAAGGIIDGRGLVAALALGASGVLMGSRFLLTRESTAPEAHKKRLLEERGESTVVTDRLSGRHARVLRNALTASYDGAALDLGEALPFPAQYLLNSDIFAAALNADDADNLPLWAGQSAGRLNDLPWAADVIGETVREARDLLQRTLPERVTLA